jgi:hypothetical protein
VFSAFLSPRATSATPEERLGASAEHLPETYRLRQLTRGSASSRFLTRLRLSSLHAAARGFAVRDLPTSHIQVPLLLEDSRPHAGDRATLSLSSS